MDLLTLSIGIGLAISLLFSELFGLAAGGMVVPGYFALFLNRPIDVVLTLGIGVLTFFIVHAVSTVVIIYGKRRTVLMILVGFLMGIAVESLPIGLYDAIAPFDGEETSDLTVIGYIIPGLIGIWIDRQGLFETLSVLLTASVSVRLIMILIGVTL